MHQNNQADLLFLGGKIFTGKNADAQTEALAVKDGRILALGKDDELQSFAAQRIVHLNGKTLMPGFIDAHSHLSMYSILLTQLDCRHRLDDDISVILERIQEKARQTPAGEWIRGWGFADYRIKQRRYPTLAEMDEAALGHPLSILHASGHTVAVNSLLLKKLGIDENTPNPAGGSIERDPLTGKVNGVLHDAAAFSFSLGAMAYEFAKQPMEKQIEVLAIGSREYTRLGITTACDAMAAPQAFAAYQAADHAGKLSCRVIGLPPYDAAIKLNEINQLNRYNSNKVKVGPIKLLADGSLSGRTAAVFRPYESTSNTGLLYYEQESLDKIVAQLDGAGLRIATHTIGDRAIAQVLSAYEKVIGKHKPNLKRHRLEHVGITSPELIQQMVDLDIVIATQPRMLYEQGDGFARSCGPDRIESVYPYRTFIENGLHVGGSSDCPVVSPDPLLGMRDAILRQTEAGQILAPAQRLDPLQSIHMWLDGSAYALCEEHERGVLEIGKAADLVVLTGDLLQAPPEQWGEQIQVEMTVVGGEIVHAKN